MKRGVIGNFDTPQKPCAVKLALWLNVLLTVSTIFLNKLLFEKFLFPNLTLTFINSLFICVAVYIARETGKFSPVRLPWRTVMIFTFGFCAFTSLGNFSLQYNSVGTFAMLKMGTLIMIPMIQCVTHRKTYDYKTLLALIPIVVGAGLHVGFDKSLTLKGFFLGFSTAAVISIYQIFVSDKQKELQLNSLHLLWYEGPISALILLPLVCIFELQREEANTDFSFSTLVISAVACSVATSVHFMTYYIIDNTTIGEYNVVSQFRLGFTLFIAYLTFDAGSIVPIQVVGDLVALCGIVIYTHLKMIEVTRNQFDVRDRVVFNAR